MLGALVNKAKMKSPHPNAQMTKPPCTETRNQEHERERQLQNRPKIVHAKNPHDRVEFRRNKKRQTNSAAGNKTSKNKMYDERTKTKKGGHHERI